MIDQYINRIINADCLDILRQLPDKCIDLVLTDPPYGIGFDGHKKYVNRQHPKWNRKEHISRRWDANIPPKQVFEQMKRVSRNIIIWGANYFNEYLEQGHKGWIIWDKMQDGLSMSDCEIAYSNFDCPTRIIRMNRVQLLKDGTIHPTQKPRLLFERILADYSKDGDLILDCFSGSGTTAVACHNLKRRFICIEKDPDYYRASVERLEKVQAQLLLF
ncbi:MAG: site-specific DNA-methyltransferase [Lentisphaeria bacterium]|nr:site-specific DNA-methyltransferase [Lentisphaeria bacterium]